jgi:PhoPQ-activated pathogenicity-related protein
MVLETHKMWQNLGGFTWAFSDYVEQNLTYIMDSEKAKMTMEMIDPTYFLDRLEKYPKMVVVTSDDEFMELDWTELYWDQMPGEKHLLISPNTEHVCITGLPTILSTLGTFMRSVGAGHSAD